VSIVAAGNAARTRPGCVGVVGALLYVPDSSRVPPTNNNIVTGRGSFQLVKAENLGSGIAATAAITGILDARTLASAPAADAPDNHRYGPTEVPCVLRTRGIWRYRFLG
jgi:hypothetical protein